MDTGREQSITITANDKMSDDEIEQAMRDAEQYAAADHIRREVLALQPEANMLIRDAENAVKSLGKELDKQEKKQIRNDSVALSKALSKKLDKVTQADLDEMRSAMQTLEASSGSARARAAGR